MLRMGRNLGFLKRFPKDNNGMRIVYELYTFDNLYRLLLKNDLSHEESLDFILCNCSLSALVFQVRIHNKRYRQLLAKDALPADLAACKARLIYNLITIR
jgi:hypothetical protein